VDKRPLSERFDAPCLCVWNADGKSYPDRPYCWTCLIARGRALEARERELVGALQWCSGSADFNEGGVAREGWLKGCAPLLRAIAAGEPAAREEIGVRCNRCGAAPDGSDGAGDKCNVCQPGYYHEYRAVPRRRDGGA